MDDPERLRALRRYEVLDTEPEAAFDNIAELAAHLFDTPIGIVNLIDSDRQWFKATTEPGFRETRLEVSFCVHTLDQEAPLVVEDLRMDARFAENPYVVDGGFRFYAGAPLLTSDGHRLGTVCVLDDQVRSPSEALVDQLQKLASMVIDELELRRESARRKRVEAALRRSREQYRTLFENAREAILVHNSDGTIKYGNKKARSLFGGEDELVGASPATLHPFGLKHVPRHAFRVLRQGQDFSVVTEYERADGDRFWGHLTASAVDIDGETLVRCTIHDVTDKRRADRLQKMQARLFEQIATGTERNEVLRQLAHFAEAEVPDASLAVFILEDEALSHAVSPSLPPSVVERWDEGQMESSPHAYAAVGDGREVEVPDLRDDPRWPDSHEEAGGRPLRSCWATPIRSEDTMRGVLAVYGSEPGGLDPDDKSFLQSLSCIAGVAIEKQQKAAELRHHRELLDHAQGLAQIGGWQYDVEAETLHWTDEAYRIHGMPVGAPIDVERVLQFYAPEFRPVLQSNVERLVEEGGTYDLELPLNTADGERRWVRTIGRAHRDAGKTVRLTGAIQDVTHRHQVREELRQKREILRTVLDSLPVMVALLDREGAPQVVNRHAEDVLGWSREELTGSPTVYQKLFPDPAPREEVQSFIQNPTETWKEFRVRTKEGGSVPVEGMVVPAPDDRRVAIGIDVSDRNQRERRLRWAQRLANLGYWARDLETGELLWSDETKRIFGWSEDREVTYEAFMEAVHPDDRDRLRAAKEAMMAGEGNIDIEYRIRRPSGEERTVSVRGELRRDSHDRPVAIMGAVLDVTERVRRREELKHAKQDAEEASRIKSALLSNMNHEFRTPLTSVISFSKIIKDNPEMADDFAERILGGGNRLLRTLNRVMDFAEVEGEQLTPTPQVVRVGDVVASVLDDFRRRARQKDLSLELDSPQDDVTAEVDPYYLERICTHLISNAVKFTEEGGATVTVQPADGGVEVIVADTGIGIPADFLPAVYDEFAQASSGDNRTHEGNGLGLTIAKRFTDRLGGTLRIESELGEGTRATLRLPAEPPSAE